jgi:hypothetical protein
MRALVLALVTACAPQPFVTAPSAPDLIVNLSRSCVESILQPFGEQVALECMTSAGSTLHVVNVIMNRNEWRTIKP